MIDQNKKFYEIMIFLLIESLKNINSGVCGDIRIFFLKDQSRLSFIIGKEYEYKKLKIKEDHFSIKLANNQGFFKTHKIFYKNIIGFCSDVIYIFFSNHNFDYSYTKHPNNLKTKLSLLFNEQIIKDFNSMNLEKNTVKITFFEQFPGIEISQNFSVGDKLLVLILEPNCWTFNLEKDGVRIFLTKQKSQVYLPFNSIVTYFNNNEGLFLNRNVKIVEEDYEEEDHYIYEDNLVFVNFKEILKEEEEEDYNLFHLFNSYTNNIQYTGQKTEKNRAFSYEDNLILGDFTREDNEGDKT